MKSKKIYVLVTIDTECDKGSPGWHIKKPMSFENIPLQEKLLMPLFNKYGIVPTYLLSPEVLQDQRSVEQLKALDNVELGTHLHEEFIAPNANYDADRTKNVQANLPLHIEKEKLKNLTNLFYEKTGVLPKSFRSGRFGSSKHTTKILADLGYLVDSSVVPYTTLCFDNYTIDSWEHTTSPFFEYFDDKRILQVPLTVINPHFEKLPSVLKKQVSKQKSKVKSLLKKLGGNFKTRQLRPYRESGKNMINIAEHVITNHFKKEPLVLLNIMFHSNEILVNGSPYCKSEEEVESFISSLDELFDHLNKNYELCSTGLGDVYSLYVQN